MNSDNVIQLVQKGFRVSLGATTNLIESIQDSQKREETFSKLMRSEFNQLTQEWEEKGEATEKEARNFVDSLLNQQNQSTSTSATADTSETPTTTANPEVTPDVQQELQELTEQIAAMRAELENLRQQNDQP